MQQLSAQGAVYLRGEEGFVDHWYADPGGVGTIGIGFTWSSGAFRQWWLQHRAGQPFGPGATMTKDEADACLIFVCASEYGLNVSQFFAKDVAQNVFDGTLSVVYNCGRSALSWRWAQDIRRGAVSQGCMELRTTATTQDGVVLAGLITRRAEEAQLIELGDYTLGNATSNPGAGPVLVLGEHGEDVANMQTLLMKQGLYAGTIDGRFGYGTQAAVLWFQRTHHLNADGKAGPKTLAALAA